MIARSSLHHSSSAARMNWHSENHRDSTSINSSSSWQLSRSMFIRKEKAMICASSCVFEGFSRSCNLFTFLDRCWLRRESQKSASFVSLFSRWWRVRMTLVTFQNRKPKMTRGDIIHSV